MKRLGNLLAAGTLALMLMTLAGCATADRAHTGQLASLEMSAQSYAQVREATIAVFTGQGYEQTVGLMFEKKGSFTESAVYGGWTATAVWTRIKVKIDYSAPGQFAVGCDAYTVKDRNQWILEEEQKNYFSKRSECERLLQLIQARLEAAPSDDASPASP